MKYQHQAAPNAPIESFSDSVSRVRGITTRPAWAWSKGYRQWHRDQINAQSRTRVGPKDREHAYLCWYESAHGRDACIALTRKLRAA